MLKQFSRLLGTCFLVFGTGCGMTVHRVPPGQSLSVALAKKAVALEQPAPHAQPVAIDPSQVAVEPDLPENDVTRLADLITSANFFLAAGKPKEAINAYEEVVRIKPDFGEARYNLAVLYQQNGEEEKALEAFKKFKQIGQR